MALETNRLIEFGFAVHTAKQGRLLGFDFSHRQGKAGRLLNFGFTHSAKPPRRLLGMSLSHIESGRRFNNGDALGLGVGAFDLAVTIDGKPVDMCQFAESMTITHGENEAYTCQFVLQQVLNRPAAPIDLYQWYGKEIIIELLHDGGMMRLYRGIVDSVQLDLLSGKTNVDCTDRRARLNDRIEQRELDGIGYYSEAVFGKFANKRDELTKRLNTIAASYEYDAYGNGYLNPWKPSAPVRVLGDCDIYYRPLRVKLATVGQVVNSVSIELGYNYDRLLQRSITFNYDVGLTLCSRGYTQHPTLNSLQEAVAQTGWTMGGGSLEADPPSQWVSCGTHKYGWVRNPGSQAVWRGQFEAVKRWTQNVNEKVVFTLKNSASIARYEEMTDNVSASVSASLEYDWQQPETPQYQKETGNRFNALYLARPDKTAGFAFNQAPNGDWYADLADAQAQRSQAFLTLYHQAYTKMLASHRQNTLDLQIKFLPEISLRHTHRIEHSQFKGNVKVARFTHTFDLLNGIGETAVTYRFFQAPKASETLTEAVVPPRPQTAWAHYQKQFALRRLDLPKGVDVDLYKGVLYQQNGIGGLPPQSFNLYQLTAVRLDTPAIEKQSTDAAQAQSSLDFEVELYSDDVQILI